MRAGTITRIIEGQMWQFSRRGRVRVEVGRGQNSDKWRY